MKRYNERQINELNQYFGTETVIIISNINSIKLHLI